MSKGNLYMPDSSSTIIQLIIDSLPAAALSLFGGFVSLFTGNNDFSWKYFIGGLLAAVFVGFLINILMLEWDINEQMRVVAVSIGGYCARDVLELISKKFISNMKDKLNGE